MLQQKLGTRLAARCKACERAQSCLATMVGCSVEFFSLMERGGNTSSVAWLEKCSKARKVEVVDLFMIKRQERVLHAFGH